MKQVYEVEVNDYGTQRWYQNDLLHRLDGPAIIHKDGDQSWYQNGKLHRTDGPAIIYKSGTQSWYQNGKLHRTDGPAVILPNGNKEWWIDGKEYTQSQFEALTLKQSKPCSGKIVIVDGVEYTL
jgi:hypothetical protein